MKNRLIATSLLLAAASVALPGGAETLSPSGALARLQASSTARRVMGNGDTPSSLSLAHTAMCHKAGLPAYYVFDKPSGGYLILSADDRLADVLADVDSSKFDPENLPANMKWWLGEYEREIDWVLTTDPVLHTKGETNAPSRIIMKDTRHNVEPLIETHWNQDAPYNDLCPTFDDKKAMTGCVATAMAQIINYHRWPKTTGFGSHSYTYRGRSYSFDYENTTFDWDNMRNSYSSGSVYTPEESKAVATLMYACGVGVDMEYGPDESGAVSFRIAPAFRDFFGYAESTSLVIRDTYSLWEWEELMYQEMAGGRPVCYSGIGGMGGHQFVIDGYRADNFFHVNWGWSGISDGYFRLTSLNPSLLGIGGGGGNFNYMQEAVVRMCPPATAQLMGLEPLTPVYIKGNFISTGIDKADDEGCVIDIAFRNGGMYANITHDLPGQFGILLTDQYENELGYYGHMDVNFRAGTQYGLYGYHNATAYVPRPEKEGNYRVYPAFCPEGGVWTRIPTYNGGNRFITLSVDKEGMMTFGNEGLTQLPELEVVDLIIKYDIVTGEKSTLLVDCLNGNVDYNGQLHLYLSETSPEDSKNADASPAYPLASVYLDIPANLYNLYEIPVLFTQAPGEYKVFFADCLNRRISSDFTVTVHDDDENDVSVDTVTATDKSSSSEWYDLQGRRLYGKPSEPGLYIERQGTHHRKVVIRS